MSGLLGPNGQPISSGIINKKASPPKLGESFGNWAGRDVEFMQLPGGGVVQFDLSKLTLSDFRAMRDHYQVNASLAVLSFMQHQADWHIECKDKRIAEHCEENLRNMWTQLNRSLSTANWAGYSPNALQWDNDINGKTVQLTKIKDLYPEESMVKWDFVEGWAPPGATKPKFKTYGGIRQLPTLSSRTYGGSSYPIPVENSLWYPILMENGDYYGKKMLRPAFTSWFFSILIHLFANRYYERFGEPTPIGRAPFDEDIELDQSHVRGNVYMLQLLQQLRNRSVVVLPNDHSQSSHTGRPIYDYDIEYLESQMRGADFERYNTRLDEEISIGLFTPILLLRTADVGSYNLGTAHMQMYQWMLNALNDDRAVYIDNYVLRRMVDYNFSEKAPDARIIFRKLGTATVEMVKDIITALVTSGKIEPDVTELGQIAGMTLKEINQTVGDPNQPPGDPGTGTGGNGPDAPPGGGKGTGARAARGTVMEIYRRVKPQVEKAFREDRFGANLQLSMGFKKRLATELETIGVSDAAARTDKIYDFMDGWSRDVVALGPEEFSSPQEFMDLFVRALDSKIAEAVGV